MRFHPNLVLFLLCPWACAEGVLLDGPGDDGDAGPRSGANDRGSLSTGSANPPAEEAPPASSGNGPQEPESSEDDSEEEDNDPMDPNEDADPSGDSSGGSESEPSGEGGMDGVNEGGATNGGSAGASQGEGGSTGGSAGAQPGGSNTGGSAGGCGAGVDVCECAVWSSGMTYMAPNDVATIPCAQAASTAPCVDYAGQTIAVRCISDVEACKYQTPNGFGPAGNWDFVQECEN